MADTSTNTPMEGQRVPVNMYEADEALVVVAPLPGVMPSDLDVTVEGRQLTIRAAMRTMAPKDYLLHEWHYGPYERTVNLPDGFGGEATGSFGNGQLAVRVKRGAVADSARRSVAIGEHHGS